MDYLQTSARTVPPTGSAFHSDLVPLDTLIDTLEGALTAAAGINDLKRALFYGKDNDDLRFTREVLIPDMANRPYPKLDPNLVHALVGIITEANELGEVLLKYLKTGEIDPAKLKDESGDEMWYLALLFRTLGTTFEEVGALNDAKLLKRFPIGFTQEAAVNRNESNENTVFQQT